jgi:hypothetical protein
LWLVLAVLNSAIYAVIGALIVFRRKSEIS